MHLSSFIFFTLFIIVYRASGYFHARLNYRPTNFGQLHARAKALSEGNMENAEGAIKVSSITGEYSMTCEFGTPPQQADLMIDTSEEVIFGL